MRSIQASTSGVCVQDAGHRRVHHPAEPQRVVGRKVGHAWRITQQKRLLFEHGRQAAQVAAVGRGGIARAQAGHVGAHGTAVGGKSLRRFGRLPGKHGRCTLGAEVVAHGGPEQGAVGPLRQHAGNAFLPRGEQRRPGLAVLQHIADQRGVAIDVGADLQKRRATVATRERQHIGLGHDARNDHALPGQLLVAQDQPHLFGERRSGVVVKNQIGHGEGLSMGA